MAGDAGGADGEALTRRLEALLRADPLVMDALVRTRAVAARAGLSGWRIVSGVLYGAVWNALDGRPSGYGLKDIDIAYHDADDLSFDAEDRVIRAAAPAFEGLAAPVEIRNQARVHLWYPARFGRPCPAYRSVEHAIEHYATRAHAVGVRLEDCGRLDVFAPFGLEELFERRLAPNRALENAETHRRKSARIAALWPATRVEAW